MDLEALLPELLPGAIAWAQVQEEQATTLGVPLTTHLINVARHVGVRNPEKIRIKLVSELPLPEEPTLREAALQTGLLGPGMVGLTIGYGIFIISGHDSIRLISHECRHVHQYEQLGSIEQFLPVYLQQIVSHSYNDAPLEIDARAHEIDSA